MAFKSSRVLNYTGYRGFATTIKTPFPGQKFLFFFGAPGVGKGTYAELLAKDLGYTKISTGDELRAIIKGKTETKFDPKLIQQIKDIVNSGKLVSDDIVINIIEQKVKDPSAAKGVILDGFPRTVSQLEKYDKKFPTHLVVNITLQEDILLEKLLGRRTCDSCGKGYNICDIHRDGYEMEPLLPKVEGKCDKCGGKLITRADDTNDVISARMKEYEAKTLPLLEIYKTRGELINFEARKGVKDYPRLLDLIKPKINKVNA